MDNNKKIQTAQEWADEMLTELGLTYLVEKPEITKNSGVSEFCNHELKVIEKEKK